MNLQGSIPAIITPFKEDLTIDYDRLAQLIEFHVEAGSAGILVLGTTGEAPTIKIEEQIEVVRFTVEKVAGRIPVIAGSGTNDTSDMVKRSLLFEGLGVDGLLLITPYYNRSNESGMVKHFETVADAVNIPTILYTVPGRTGCNISPSVVEKLSKHPHIIGIKDATGDFSYSTQISRYVSNEFRLYSGNDDTIVPLMSLGASGAISVWANFMPKEVANLVKLYLDGNTKESLKLQQQYLDLVNALFIETNPIPLKYVMKQLEMDSGLLRMPLDEASDEAKATIDTLLEELGLR